MCTYVYREETERSKENQAGTTKEKNGEREKERKEKGREGEEGC